MSYHKSQPNNAKLVSPNGENPRLWCAPYQNHRRANRTSFGCPTHAVGPVHMERAAWRVFMGGGVLPISQLI